MKGRAFGVSGEPVNGSPAEDTTWGSQCTTAASRRSLSGRVSLLEVSSIDVALCCPADGENGGVLASVANRLLLSSSNADFPSSNESLPEAAMKAGTGPSFLDGSSIGYED